jgi:hypothetical protein
MPFDLNAESLDQSTVASFKRSIDNALHEMGSGGWNRTMLAVGVMERRQEKRMVIQNVNVILIHQSVGEKIAVDLFNCVYQALRRYGKGNRIKFIIADKNLTEVQFPNDEKILNYVRSTKDEDDGDVFTQISDFAGIQNRQTLSIIIGKKTIKGIKIQSRSKVLKCAFEEVSSLPGMYRITYFER